MKPFSFSLFNPLYARTVKIKHGKVAQTAIKPASVGTSLRPTPPKGRRQGGLTLLLLASLLLGCYLSLRFGAINFSHTELLAVLGQPLLDSPSQDVIIDLRLPRVLAAIIVGSSLAMAGAILQGVTRNPIADPSLLGINTGAALALAVSLILFPKLNYLSRILITFLGAGLTFLLVFSFARSRRSHNQEVRLILAGVMVTNLFNAIGQALIIRFNLASAIIGWQAGGLNQTNWKMLGLVAPLSLLTILGGLIFAHQLTILNLNESISTSLGQHSSLVSFIFLVLTLGLTATAVSLVGNLTFVGLIIPQLARLIAPQDYRKILPLTLLMGGSFLVWADLISRTINPPYETPLTAVVSLVGLPSFLWLVRRWRS